MDSWEGTGSGFKGKISHHGRGKPFKDGFVNKKAASAEQATSEEQEQEGNDVGPDRDCRRLPLGSQALSNCTHWLNIVIMQLFSSLIAKHVCRK